MQNNYNFCDKKQIQLTERGRVSYVEVVNRGAAAFEMERIWESIARPIFCLMEIVAETKGDKEIACEKQGGRGFLMF